MELLEENRVIDALHCLRIELTPMKFNISRVHELSRYVFSHSQFFVYFDQTNIIIMFLNVS